MEPTVQGRVDKAFEKEVSPVYMLPTLDSARKFHGEASIEKRQSKQEGRKNVGKSRDDQKTSDKRKMIPMSPDSSSDKEGNAGKDKRRTKKSNTIRTKSNRSNKKRAGDKSSNDSCASDSEASDTGTKKDRREGGVDVGRDVPTRRSHLQVNRSRKTSTIGEAADDMPPAPILKEKSWK